ncbi:MAG: aromatic-ring-hydroxylating dioxygenase subunit beta [Candidatus Eremiobacteraeota bacterium]|nr:aromatic-ring-hydroxylating dioxygenase subunit beta [Candidatus Eremiobacteraeota bacterium]
MTDAFSAIGALNARYARCIDDAALSGWPEFFTDRCLYKVTTAANYAAGLEGALIYADSRAMLVDRVAALAEANIYERHAYRHILGAPFVVGQDAGETRSETPFIVVRIMRDGTSDVFASGKYVDVVRFEDGDAKLAERIVVCDSSRIDTLLALPL